MGIAAAALKVLACGLLSEDNYALARKQRSLRPRAKVWRADASASDGWGLRGSPVRAAR